MTQILKIFFFTGVVLLSINADSCRASSDDLVDVGDFEFSLAIGQGTFDSPLALYQTRNFNLLPQLTWYGERAFFDNGLFGYAISENEKNQWDWVLYPNNDGLVYEISEHIKSPLIFGFFEPDRIIVLKRPQRDLSWMSGIAFSTELDNWFVNSKLAFDVTSIHRGWELDFNIGNNSLYQQGDFNFALETGVTLKSSQLVDYYYTPQPGEITPPEGDFYLPEGQGWVEVGPYEGHTGWVVNTKLKFSYRLSEHFSLIAFYSRFWMSGELTKSPIIVQSNYSATFAGLQYRY